MNNHSYIDGAFQYQQRQFAYADTLNAKSDKQCKNCSEILFSCQYSVNLASETYTQWRGVGGFRLPINLGNQWSDSNETQSSKFKGLYETPKYSKFAVMCKNIGHLL